MLIVSGREYRRREHRRSESGTTRRTRCAVCVAAPRTTSRSTRALLVATPANASASVSPCPVPPVCTCLSNLVQRSPADSQLEREGDPPEDHRYRPTATPETREPQVRERVPLLRILDSGKKGADCCCCPSRWLLRSVRRQIGTSRFHCCPGLHWQDTLK